MKTLHLIHKLCHVQSVIVRRLYGEGHGPIERAGETDQICLCFKVETVKDLIVWVHGPLDLVALENNISRVLASRFPENHPDADVHIRTQKVPNEE